ncbi:MAG: MFS transporter [bacterium]
MIQRFALYGFLKNQRYFEPFLLLYFLDSGLNFSQIGVLIFFRELSKNLFEIPSGGIADLYGRRRSMILSFVFYIFSLQIFFFFPSFVFMIGAMVFFGMGEAFRSGTHKAMIFAWLDRYGRLQEKNKIYGYTRSWSKIGSAVSIVIASAIVLILRDFSWLFALTLFPYILEIINFLGYPDYLNLQSHGSTNTKSIFFHLWNAFKDAFQIPKLRRLLTESMSFEGMFASVKDYIQPIIKNSMLLLPLLIHLTEFQRTTVMVSITYLLFHIFSAWGSRKSYKISQKTGSLETAADFIWKVTFLLYMLLLLFILFKIPIPLIIIIFILLYFTQNLWRPILISRFESFAIDFKAATILSIESQAKSVSVMILAPVIGFSIDLVKPFSQGVEFWPIGVIGCVISGLILLRRR